MSDTGLRNKKSAAVLQSVKVLLVMVLWSLPAWLVWRVFSQPVLQQGLTQSQVGTLVWYPLIAVLMLFFAVILYRRLPATYLGLFGYLISTLVLPGLHYWLSNVTTLTLLFAEWATFSLTIFVMGFSIELIRRIFIMTKKGYWKLVIFGGLANIFLFVVPGVLIAASLYQVLYFQGLFQGGLVLQMPYILALAIAIAHEWRSFKGL